MSKTNLPKGWIKTKLKDIVELKYGMSLPARQRDGRKFPVFGSNGIVGQHSQPFIDKEGIIIGRKGSNGVVQVSDGPFSPIDTSYYIDELFDQPLKFWFYLLSSLQLTKLNRATTIPSLNRDDAYALIINLPSLAEQKIIADKLDVFFEKIETIRTSLESTINNLKEYRRSVLNDAISGNLISSNYDLWEEERLKNLTIKISSGATPRGGRSVYKKTGTPLVRSLNIYTDYIKYDDLVFIDDEQASKLDNVTIEKNDVLFNITGASIGRVNIAPEDFVGGRVNQHVMIIRCIQTKLISKFLYIYLASPKLQKWIENENYGATREALTKGMIEEIQLAIPPVDEQVEIVRHVEELFTFADSIEQEVNVALDRVNSLPQSILVKAFQGDLTADWREANPELISGENSAEALLKKIKIERKKLENHSKVKNRTTTKKKAGKSMSSKIITVTEALRKANKPLSGQQLLNKAGYPNDSALEELEKYFLDIREALVQNKIVQLERDKDQQDWFTLAETII